jgi:hypothetical protein
VAGGALLAGGSLLAGLPPRATAGSSSAQDVDLLSFALTLEYLEAEFYAQAAASGALGGDVLSFAQVVGAHEREHVLRHESSLAGTAVAKPVFDFKGTTGDQALFLATAVVLEETAVAAYGGIVPQATKRVRAAAAMILSVEARHAAWARELAGRDVSPRGFDDARSVEETLARVAATGFVTG